MSTFAAVMIIMTTPNSKHKYRCLHRRLIYALFVGGTDWYYFPPDDLICARPLCTTNCSVG